MTTNFKHQNVDLDSIYEAADPAVYKNIPKSGGLTENAGRTNGQWQYPGTWRSIETNDDNQFAISTDGRLFGRGDEGASLGSLGLSPAYGNVTEWTPVVDVGPWKSVSTFGKHLGIKTDGTLWEWGEDTIWAGTISKPQQVGTSTWKSAYVGGWMMQMVGIKSDGTLWTWGFNGYGSLGKSSTYSLDWISSPMLLSSNTTWQTAVTIDGVLAIRSDGTLWGVGDNLGLTSGSTLMQVGTAKDWKQIAGSWQTGFAIKTDGSLWSWGNNDRGILGTNSTAPSGGLTRVGALTNWKEISFNDTDLGRNPVAIKTDGTLWSWGDNTHYQLGTGDTVPRSSPVQIGSQTNWLTARSSRYGIIAIQE